MATPVSSRIDRKGDPARAVLAQAFRLPSGQTLPSGSVIMGSIVEVRPAYRKNAGQVRLRFTRLENPTGSLPIDAQVITPDGWLRQGDQNSAAWRVDPNHSTRLLNDKIQRRLGSNRAVWASVLGINANLIPDPTTDAFIQDYHRRDVLVGAGDTLTLRWVCR